MSNESNENKERNDATRGTVQVDEILDKRLVYILPYSLIKYLTVMVVLRGGHRKDFLICVNTKVGRKELNTKGNSSN